MRDIAGHWGTSRLQLISQTVTCNACNALALHWQCTASFRLWKWLSMERSKLACPNLCSTASLQYCSIFYISNLQTICSEHSEICHFHEAQEARVEGLGSVSSFQDFCSRWKARHLKHSSTPFCVADCRMCRRW